MYSFKNDEFYAVLDAIETYWTIVHQPNVIVPPDVLAKAEKDLASALLQVRQRHEHNNRQAARNLERYRRENPEYLRGKKARDYFQSQQERSEGTN